MRVQQQLHLTVAASVGASGSANFGVQLPQGWDWRNTELVSSYVGSPTSAGSDQVVIDGVAINSNNTVNAWVKNNWASGTAVFTIHFIVRRKGS